MNRVFFLFLPLILSACATGVKAPDSRSAAYEVINLGSDFEQFWTQAENKPFEEQVVVWNQTVEHPHQSFYDGMVWQKVDNPKWEERKLRV